MSGARDRVADRRRELGGVRARIRALKEERERRAAELRGEIESRLGVPLPEGFRSEQGSGLLEARRDALHEDVRRLNARVVEIADRLAQRERDFANLSEQGEAVRQEAERWRSDHARTRAAASALSAELEEWKRSRAWKIASLYWKVRSKLRPAAPPAPPAEPAPPAAAWESTAAAAAPAVPPLPPVPENFRPLPSGRPDVVVFSIIDWDFRFQRPQQIAAQFGRHGHRTFYLSTTQFFDPGGPAWWLTGKAENVAELKVRSRREIVNIYIARLDDEDLDAFEEVFAQAAGDLGIGDAVAIVQLPFWAPLAERLRRRLGWKIVYDCMDEWTNFPGFGEDVLALEEGLVRSADVTVVSADRLVGKWQGRAGNLVLARNGVDLDHYRALYGPNSLLDPIIHPVIGYYGALASWVDVPLLEKIAARFPHATIVLAGGHFDVDLSPIASLPNVRLLGQRPYAEMPWLLWNFDVCVIPFLVNDITEATNPVKFYEYLSGGKPVVAPDLTELRPFRDLCYLSAGHDEFLAQLDRALHEDPEDPRRQRRREVAAANDWSARYRTIVEAVDATWPLVSVVLVTFGAWELTRACLESLLERETWPRFEVIVVDNASPDESPARLEELAAADGRVRLIRNDSNRGFAAANNQGIAAARGDFVVLLNNDTVVPPGLLGRLVRHLERDETLGLLCPTTNFCGNEAKVEVDYDSLDDMPWFAVRRARDHSGRVFDLPVAAMYCVAARRAVLDRVGPLDEAFGVGMFEDDDFALRMRQAGFRVACAEDSYVHHVGQGSFSKLSPAEYEALWKRNQDYYERKWGVEWKRHETRAGIKPPVSKLE